MKQNLQQSLENVFWLSDFREGQKEIIECILAGENALVFMPTGGGKSLTYQLPWVMLEWLTIVISPLISLMKDQVDTLREKWIKAAFLNSTLTSAEQWQVLSELSDIKFLYIAPERLSSTRFLQSLQNIQIALIAIDEAHCISQWGHDFRPSYMKIKNFIQELAWSFPLIALTATATQKVRKDIVDRLGIEKYQTFISGFDRKNITIVVREISAKEEKQKKVLEILEKTPGTGIIYCSSRKHVVELHEFLLSRGVKAGLYKWDLTPEKRDMQQNAFMNDEYRVMVATNAFGMGIDKKDIRFVIHYNLPGSIENYYQEVGRAGRDGKKSFWVVLASYGDTKIQEFFIENTYPNKLEVLDFYEYLFKDFELGGWKDTSIAKTYQTMAQESWVSNDMRVGSIIKILEKYGIVERWVSTKTQEDFRGRWITLMQEKRQKSHILIDWKRQDALKQESYYKLEQIKRLLFYPSCRKRFILEYFGDEEDLKKLWDNCGACDFCLEWAKFESADIEKILQASSYIVALETIKKYNEKFGAALIAKVLWGSEDKRILDWNLDLYEHYWALREYSEKTISAILEVLQMQEFLYKTDGKYPVLGITEIWIAAVYKNKYVQERLEELNRYILQKVGKEVQRFAWSQDSKGKANSKPRGETYKQTLELFRAWKSLSEIAKIRELNGQTIEGHIVNLYEKKEISLLDIMKLLDFWNAKIIKECLEGDALLEEAWLKSLKEKLESQGYKDITYFDIKLTLAMIDAGDM